MKITDEEFLKSIWLSVAYHLPYGATHNYYGDCRGLVPNDKFYVRYSTHVCTARRSSRIKLPIGNAQSMNRIKKLIADGRLGAEKQRRGNAFYFWLPDEFNQRAFERTLHLLAENGITTEPVDGSGFEDIATKISQQLLREIGEMPVEILLRKAS